MSKILTKTPMLIGATYSDKCKLSTWKIPLVRMKSNGNYFSTITPKSFTLLVNFIFTVYS